MNAIAPTDPRLMDAASAGESTMIQKVGFFFLLIFLFLSFSRLTDLYFPGLRLPLVFSILALVAGLMTGGIFRALSTWVGICLTGLTLWLIVDVPFSFWPGGSLNMLTDKWFKSVLVFFLVAGLIRTKAQCRAAMYTMASATVVIVVMCLAMGSTEVYGRLSVQGQGVLANPNDLAQLILMGLPFVVLAAMTPNRISGQGPLAWLGCFGVLAVATRTGSRMGMLTLALLLVVLVMSVSWSNRFKILAAVLVAGALLFPMISPEQRARYLTLFEDTSAVQDENEAVAAASSQQRLNLLKDSIVATFRNPLFGVGPGVFAAASASSAERSGEFAAWRETHNMFTQISSEAGLPAFAFFMGALIWCLRSTRRIYREGKLDTGHSSESIMAFCLWLAFMVLVVTGFFSSVGYGIYLPTLAGLSVALHYACETERVEHVATPAAAPVFTPISSAFRMTPR